MIDWVKEVETKKIFQAVSRIFDPVVEIPIALVLAVWFAVSNSLRWRFLVGLLFLDAVVPFVFFLIMLVKGEVSNWDIRDRRERIPIYLFSLFMHFLGVGLAWVTGKHELLVILLAFYGVALLFMGITFFWKISLHTGVNALLVTFFNLLMGWSYLWLYVIVLIVGWARVEGKHHTIYQIAAGALLGGFGFMGLYRIFEYLL